MGSLTGSMADSVEVRRRRLLWRASHRGTKELDIVIGRYADAHVSTMDETALARFERFLEREEPDLQSWILGGAPPPSAPDLDLIRAIRHFHGLE